MLRKKERKQASKQASNLQLAGPCRTPPRPLCLNPFFKWSTYSNKQLFQPLRQAITLMSHGRWSPSLLYLYAALALLACTLGCSWFWPVRQQLVCLDLPVVQERPFFPANCGANCQCHLHWVQVFFFLSSLCSCGESCSFAWLTAAASPAGLAVDRGALGPVAVGCWLSGFKYAWNCDLDTVCFTYTVSRPPELLLGLLAIPWSVSDA